VSEWRASSGRKGTPKIPIKKGERMAKCKACGQEVKVYGTDLERHKVYDKKNPNRWHWCERRQL